MPYDSKELPPPVITKELIAFSAQKGWGLIIGTDANSHNEVWGSTDTNKRGEELLDYLATTQMHICNEGVTPTFSNILRQEVIDITLASNNAINSVEHWKVSNAETFSDHARIEFKLRCKIEIRIDVFQNVRKTDWNTYRNKLNEELPRIQNFKELDLEEMSLILEQGIMKAYTSNCPISKSHSTQKPIWWNRELTKLKQIAERFKQKKRRNPTDRNQTACSIAITEYKREIRRAKSESWERFCSGINNLSTTAKLQKVLKLGTNKRISTIRKTDGSYTITPEETLEELMRVLFPDKEEEVNQTVVVIPNNNKSELNISQITNKTAIKEAIKSFSPYKSPGTDGIYPALLQQGEAILNPYLQTIYQESLEKEKLPKRWTETKAVFIPKPGKEDYTDPKAYRPISLSSFLLKGLERLVHWYLLETNLKQKPLHPNLSSYREGMSTENSLHKSIHKIEKALTNRNFAIAVFLDISGAFSDASIEGMINVMNKRQIEPKLINWISHMLKNRKATATLLDSEVTKNINRGTPQGGILSPTIWNMNIDDCLRSMRKKGPVDGHAFADDVKIIGVGIDERTIAQNLQRELRTLEQWAKEHSLSFNPNKSKVMIFTRKTKFKQPKLYIEGKELEYVKEFKYLGVTIDNKLSWKPHIETQAKKANRALMAARKMIGTKWGLSPKHIDWIYKGIARPILAYGAIVWAPGLRQKYVQNILSKLQRKACLMITRGIQSTPTAGMEAILGMTPLPIYLKGEALKTYTRIESTKQWAPKRGEELGDYSHTKLINKLKMELVEIQQPTGKLVNKERIRTNFQVNILEREEIHTFRPKPTEIETINCFTDGSKTEDGCGAAYIIMGHNLKRQDSIPLGKNCTVFQAELVAITEASRELNRQETKNKQINIYIDSQSAINALERYIIKDKMVLEGKIEINKLAENNNISLNWIPGHEGHMGNEVADRLAKRGSQMEILGPEPSVPIQSSQLKKIVEEWCRTEHQKEWSKRTDCRQTKMLLPDVKHNMGKSLLNMPINQSRIATQILTGHANLRRHLYLMGMEDSPICEKCEEEEETVLHFLANCPRYSYERWSILGHSKIKSEELQYLKLRDIMNYTSRTRRWMED